MLIEQSMILDKKTKRQNQSGDDPSNAVKYCGQHSDGSPFATNALCHDERITIPPYAFINQQQFVQSIIAHNKAELHIEYANGHKRLLTT